MTAGKLFLVGVTHRTAPLGRRERLSLTADTEAALAGELATMPGLQEFVMLNTCNRVEIYAVGDDASLARRVAEAFCARQGFALPEFERLRLELEDRAVVQHLLAVASGLDSQMIGENEIFGQVKKALQIAQQRGSAGPVLNRIFQKAFQAAKHVRTHTEVSAGLVSLGNVAVEIALRVFGRMDDTRVLVLGAGDIGLKSGRAFRSRGAGALTVASRRLERAQEVAAELEATALPFEDALAQLAAFDVVVCSTSAPGTVISAAMVTAARAQRRGRPQLYVDVALPRDVEVAVGAMENVFLHNLDDLAKIAAENRTARQAEITKCEEILEVRSVALWSQIKRRLNPAPASGPAQRWREDDAAETLPLIEAGGWAV